MLTAKKPVRSGISRLARTIPHAASDHYTHHVISHRTERKFLLLF